MTLAPKDSWVGFSLFICELVFKYALQAVILNESKMGHQSEIHFLRTVVTFSKEPVSKAII